MDITKGATKSEIAAYYQVSHKVLNIWLQPLKKQLQSFGNKSRIYTPKQVEIIIKHIGPND